MIKSCVTFSLQSFGTAKTDYVINEKKMFSFMPLINILNFTIELSLFFLLFIIATIISKTINISRFFLDCTYQHFCGYHLQNLNIQCKLYNLYNALSLQFHGF